MPATPFVSLLAPPATAEPAPSAFATSTPAHSTPARPPGPTLSAGAARDLQLDRLFAAMADGVPWLAERYATACTDAEVVRYRQAISRDLERPEVAAVLDRFVHRIAAIERRLDALAKVPSALVSQARLLAAAHRYVTAVTDLAEGLRRVDLHAEGLQACRDAVAALVAGGRFARLAADAARVQAALDEVVFTVRIQGGRVTVDTDRGEPDLTAAVAATFERYRTEPLADPGPPPPDAGVDQVAARVLTLVAERHPTPFAALAAFAADHEPLLDPLVADLARDAPFYLAYHAHLARLRRAGLPLSYPELVGAAEACGAEGAYDLAVARKLVADGQPVVPNDWSLTPPERLLVVTGANQGGKTTFARAFGQIHHLASLGLPVPARAARIGLHDRVLTHFDRQEQVTSLHGKLEDELLRVRDVLEVATADSVLVLNETFSSTTLHDARELGAAVLQELERRGLRAVFVTFVDELTEVGAATVSMVAGVRPEDPTQRTFRIERREPDGLAHAVALADRYGLTYQALVERIGS
ncbi:MAG: MutS-related protein [Nitriliruptoraceae bacterium]